MFECEMKRTGENEVTIELRGDLVLGPATERFRSCLQVVADRYAITILDARGLHRIDSAGLGEMIRSRTNAQAFGNNVQLVGEGEGIRDVLILTKLVTVFGGGTVGDATESREASK